jgi:putative oxidoreductase
MNERARERLRDGGLLLLRVGLGLMMFLGHGLDKLTGFADKAERFADPLGVGSTTSLALTVFAEVVCSVLLVVGLGTRLAALVLAFTMGVAAFVVHAGDDFGNREKALLYLAGYALLALAGGGRFAFDSLLPKKLRDKLA